MKNGKQMNKVVLGQHLWWGGYQHLQGNHLQVVTLLDKYVQEFRFYG